ncbi:M14 family metallopeptidase [bacterium]|nr:M14 family metallopeptidase [bacterium]
MARHVHLGILFGLLALSVQGGASQALQTPFELSGGNETPTYSETVSWCRDLAEASPVISYLEFGLSPRGRALPLVVADRDGLADPGACRRGGDQVILLVQACIHAGESCGKDAGMLLLRDIAAGDGPARALLDNVTLLFIPIFNVDGHERFGPYNRVNQNGPREMGWRTTAQNLNLNRDFLKADAPEMQAWLGLWNAWSPDFFIDVHSTDGADYQYAITYSLETHGNLDAGLTTLVQTYEDRMNRDMAADGFPMIRYVSFRNWHDPRSGLQAWAADPRFSQGYAAVRNRPGLLIETHMLKDYANRVETTGLLVRHTMAWLNAHGGELRSAVEDADRATASPGFRDRPFPLTFQRADSCRTIDFLGVAYETATSEVTGGDYNRFGAEPEIWKVEYFDIVEPDRTVKLPAAYLVPPEWTAVLERLRWHGARFRRLAAPVDLEVRTYRFGDATWGRRPYEGRNTVEFEVAAGIETLTFPAGSAVVSLAQPAARAIAHLLEPEGPDSLARWGFFNAVFDRVEYVESYVIEAMIPVMLADRPELAAELEAAKTADPEWAKEPWNIRMWFYERTPYFDERAGLYPVGLLDDPTVLDTLPLD